MAESPPLFSVVIGTRSRPAQLASCLEALARQDYPHSRFEVIVVDDGSDPPLAASALPTVGCPNLVVVRQEWGGPGSARNRGAACAEGEALAFTDDDCQPAASWLGKLAAHLAARPGCAVGGRTLNALPANAYSTASQLLNTYLYTYYNRVPSRARFLATNNVAFPLAGFRAIGGFADAYYRMAAEDRDLCDRWLAHGYEMAYADDALVYHAHPLTLGSFWRQHLRYGRGAWVFHHQRRKRSGQPVGVEPPGFYWNLLRFPFRGGHTQRPLGQSALLLLAQIANAAGYWAEGWRRCGREQPP